MTICIIPARGGSIRIPGKNIKLFHGKPIISYSIETARQSGVFDEILVSTDAHEIAAVAERYGTRVHWRKKDNGQKGTQEVMASVLMEVFGHEDACCLYATAPMLQPETLATAHVYLQFPHVSYVVPVGKWLEDPGQFYFGNVSSFVSGASLIGSDTRMLAVDPATCCDINTMEDWRRAEYMYALRREK